jgi:hypothetical protein
MSSLVRKAGRHRGRMSYAAFHPAGSRQSAEVLGTHVRDRGLAVPLSPLLHPFTREDEEIRTKRLRSDMT